MTLEEYKEFWRNSKKNKPGQDIIERWQTRILPAGLQEMGPAGGELYLTRYGKTIASPKCIRFARYAEAQGYKWFADWFWEKAYWIDYPDGDTEPFGDAEAGIGMSPNDVPEKTSQEPRSAILEQPTSSDTLDVLAISSKNGVITDGHARFAASIAMLTPSPYSDVLSDQFPNDMQPGQLVTSQPTDAQMPREFYINDDRYWSQPKRDGNKLICFCTPYKVWYQSRQLKVNGAPSIEMDQAFKAVAELIGAFILEGELYFVDVKGREHMTGETCRAANEMAGLPNALPVMQFSAFGCLYVRKSVDKKGEQVWHASNIMDRLIDENPHDFAKLPTAKTTTEKEDLARAQKDGGREGEVYFLHDLVMRPGKITSRKDPQFDGYVRVKNYLGIQRYRVTAILPSKADGHFIGGFSIEDTDGNPVGNVGTGYRREDQREILRRFTANPDNTWVLVQAQTRTVFNKLRHAAFKGFADE